MGHSLFFRGASVSLSLFLLLPTIAAAAGPSPMGTLRANGAVYVDTTEAPSLSSLFSGDRIRTEEGRASLALPHGSSILIDPSSAVVLQKTSEGFSADLEKGRLTVNSRPQTPIKVQVGSMLFQPTGEFPSLAEVAMLGNGSMVLSVHRGLVSVQNAQEEPILVQAGKSLTIKTLPAQKDQTPGTAAHGSTTLGQKAQGFHLSHGASVVLIGGIVAATAAAIAIPLATNNDTVVTSPSTP